MFRKRSTTEDDFAQKAAKLIRYASSVLYQDASDGFLTNGTGGYIGTPDAKALHSYLAGQLASLAEELELLKITKFLVTTSEEVPETDFLDEPSYLDRITGK